MNRGAASEDACSLVQTHPRSASVGTKGPGGTQKPASNRNLCSAQKSNRNKRLVWWLPLAPVWWWLPWAPVWWWLPWAPVGVVVWLLLAPGGCLWRRVVVRWGVAARGRTRGVRSKRVPPPSITDPVRSVAACIVGVSKQHLAKYVGWLPLAPGGWWFGCLWRRWLPWAPGWWVGGRLVTSAGGGLFSWCSASSSSTTSSRTIGPGPSVLGGRGATDLTFFV